MSDDFDVSGDHVIPNFYYKPVKNNFRSKREGRPIYENREYIEIMIPGNKTERPNRPVQEKDKERWPQAYERFQRKQEQVVEGTPLETWAYIDRARVAALKESNIFTVDQLATLPDDKAESVGPDFHDLKKRARSYLESAEGIANEDRLSELEAQINELKAENEELKKNQKKKPGRKPKSEAA